MAHQLAVLDPLATFVDVGSERMPLFGFANLVLAGRQFKISETRAPS